MVAGGVHKRFAEHSLIAYVEVLLGKSVDFVFGIVVKSLVLIEEMQHILHCLCGRDYLRGFVRRASLTRACEYLCRGQRQQHIVKKYVGSTKDTVSGVIFVFVHVCV